MTQTFHYLPQPRGPSPGLPALQSENCDSKVPCSKVKLNSLEAFFFCFLFLGLVFKMLAAKCTRASSLEKKHQMHICTFICTLGRNESRSGRAWPETVLVTVLIAHPELGEALSSAETCSLKDSASCLPGSGELCLGRAPCAGCWSFLCHIPTWQGWVRPWGSGGLALPAAPTWARGSELREVTVPAGLVVTPWQRDRAGLSLQGEAGAGSAGVCVQECV